MSAYGYLHKRVIQILPLTLGQLPASRIFQAGAIMLFAKESIALQLNRKLGLNDF